VHYNYK